MFASEKVMLDYLGQLLNEDEVANADAELTESKKEPSKNSVVADDKKEPLKKTTIEKKQEYVEHTTPNYDVNKSEPQLAPEPQLRPIVSKRTELRKFKEEPEVVVAQPNSIEKLLQQVETKQVVEKKIKEDVKTVDLVETEVQIETKIETEVKTKVEAVVERAVEPPVEDVFPDEPFQALFFEVAGLVLAVPLQDLGAIHNLTDLNSLFGKPKWFKGVMVNRGKNLNVVDSARWVMPDKYDTKMEESIEYKYLITLGESNWGLTAEKLVATETIEPKAVKWRNGKGKRPWLLGTIKEKMCALLHVSDLIAMLEQGIDARQE